jgi:DNA recombination protein RmuC
MPFDWLVLALLAVLVVLTLWIAFGHPPIDRSLERQGRELRDEVMRSAQGTRQELAQALALFQQTLLAQQGDTARTQNEQIDSFGRQLAAMQQRLAESLVQATAAHVEQARLVRDALDLRMAEVRSTVEARLGAIQLDNEKKLEQIRATVDEKLHATLEQRLGESFRQVAERLEQVHRGIGEMQKLASDVGSLSRVLSNVKTRGMFGEVQLHALLDQALTLEQYATNVETVPGSNARVEFAIKLPGRRDDGAPLWLPIDCKFPRDDYERLIEAQEAADRAGVELHARAIEQRLRKEALTIREKYVSPPHTTDFGILFLPTEGLYAEALRRPGLVESLQREYKVMVTGPTTLLATLSSLQMGFRTLALEKRTSEVWETLAAVKTEFQKFGGALAHTRKKLQEATNTIDEAEKRSRVMARSLRGVEALSDERAQALLPSGGLFDEPADG